MPDQTDAVSGRAALALLESLLALLVDKQVLTQHELEEIFNVAVDALDGEAHDGDEDGNIAAARLLARLQMAGNAVRCG